MTNARIDFSHVNAWVFDLDNTLYPAACNLFAQIDQRMTKFIENTLSLPHAEARRLQKDFYVKYGTTLSGLMSEHGVKPHDFMDFVHDIDLSPVDENKQLAELIASLPGEKYIFTNGSVRHAENVTSKLGVSDLFHSIFDIAAADFTPKPHRETYDKFIAHHGLVPEQAAMFEDIACNLEAAHEIGMTTVLVASDAPWLADEPASKRPALPTDTHEHVHHVTDDLTEFLGSIETKNILPETV